MLGERAPWVVECQPTSALPAIGPCIMHQPVCLRCVALLNVGSKAAGCIQAQFAADLKGIAWLPGSRPPCQQCSGVFCKHSRVQQLARFTRLPTFSH